MKLNGSTTVDFSALDAEFSALQSSSAELRTQLETLQPDISALKNIRKYIDMVLNKQQLSAQGETLARSGKEYRWKAHDSLTVCGNKWFRHSQSKGGMY